MTTIVDLKDGTTALAGLAWESFSAPDWKKQRKTRPKAPRTIYEVSTGGKEKEVLVGEVLGESDEVIPVKSVSLAAACARSFPDISATIVEKLGEDIYWFCAISKERVISGTDIVGPLSEIVGEVAQHQELMAGADETLMGNGIEDLIPGEHAESILDLISSSDLSAATIKGLSRGSGNGSVTPLKIALLVGAFGALGYGFYVTLVPEKPTQPAQSAAELARKQKVQAEIALADILRQKTKQFPVTQLSNLFSGSLGDLPTIAAGWQIDNTKCNTQVCQTVFKNTDFSSIATLETLATPVCETLTISTNGREAICEQSVTNHSMQSLAMSIDDLQEEGGQRQVLNAVISAQSTLGGRFKYEIAEPTAVAFTGKQFLEPEQIPFTGDWSISLDIGLIHEVASEYLEALPASISGVVVNWTNQNVTVTGQYFAKNITKE